MVCSCGDLCNNCKGHCTCHTGYCTYSVCHGKNICNHCFFPLCEATVMGSKDKKKFCQCLQTSEVTRSHSTTSLKIAKHRTPTSGLKSKNFESGKKRTTYLSSTPYYSSFNVSMTSEKEKAKISSMEQPHRSLLGSLKQKMRKIGSHFNKPKTKKTPHHANPALKRGNEASGESSVETDSSTNTNYSLGKKTKSLKNKENGYSTESLRQPSPKAGDVTFPSNQVYHNLEETALAKPLTRTVKGETDAFFGKQLGGPTKIFINNKQSPRSLSSSSPKDSMHSYQSCFTPFRLKLPWLTSQNAENDKLSTLSNEIQNLKSPEDVKFSIVNLKDSETSSITESPKTHRPAFLIGNVIISRSTSDDNKSTKHFCSNSQVELPSTQLDSSHFCSRPLGNKLNQGKNAELLNSSIDTQTTILTETSGSISADLNEFPEPFMTSSIASSRSSISHELNGTHHSCSLSQKPLLSSQSSSPRSTSLATFSRSFLELSLHESSTFNSSDIEDRNLTDVSTSFIVSSDFSSDFETFDTRTSPDSTDTESISSSEFLPCSYCRFVANTPLISGSIIPYEPLE